MLKKIITFKIKLELLSGLYIGGNNVGFDIGGADSNVIKNPLTKEPYIPGSSMKGKLKSLLKLKYGKPNKEVKDIDFENIDLIVLFGSSSKEEMTRGIFRDFKLTKECKEMFKNILGENVYTEIKAENKINTLKGKAETPRFIERVPAGAIFEGEIVLNILENDNEQEMIKYIKEALNLLELNYLGGSGTRGYGRVKVELIKTEEKEL